MVCFDTLHIPDVRPHSEMCPPIQFHKLKTCNAGARLNRSDKLIFTKQGSSRNGMGR